MVSGCRPPIFFCLPGSVMSRVSDWSFCSRAASAMAACCFVIADSMSERTAFASCPITGRSSAESFPICFRMAVSAPFFPRYCTRIASSCFASVQVCRAASASCRMASNCSFISDLPCFFIPDVVSAKRCQWRWLRKNGKQKRPVLKQDKSCNLLMNHPFPKSQHSLALYAGNNVCTYHTAAKRQTSAQPLRRELPHWIGCSILSAKECLSVAGITAVLSSSQRSAFYYTQFSKKIKSFLEILQFVW